MQEEDNDTSVTNEDTEILNLPLYTERKADGIYRYRRRVPKPLVPFALMDPKVCYADDAAIGLSKVKVRSGGNDKKAILLSTLPLHCRPVPGTRNVCPPETRRFPL